MTEDSTSVLVTDGPPSYGRTPRTLLRNPAITAQAKALWSLLEDYASPGSPQPFPAQATLGEYLGATVRTVRRWMRELQDQGWLDVETESTATGKRNRYTLRWTPRPAQGVRTPVSPRVRTSTTGRVRTPVSVEEEPREEEPVEVKPPSQSDSRREPTEWREERMNPRKVPTWQSEFAIVERLASQGNKSWRDHPDLTPVGRRCASRIASVMVWSQNYTERKFAFHAAWKDETAAEADRRGTAA